jgi:hypothetical protein
MTFLADNRVLFIATTGARQAAAHLVQYMLVARALGVRPLIAVAGARGAAEEALALGADVIAEATPAIIGTMQPDLVVIEDPIAAQLGGWIIAAQRAGALVVTLHELGVSALQQSMNRDITESFDPMTLAPVAVAAGGRRELR